MSKVCILGGSGFVGRHLAARLTEKQNCVRILSRHPQRHRDLLVLPGLELVKADIHDPAQLQTHLTGCDAVANLVGILNQSAGNGFQRVHAELPEKIVAACQAAGVPRLLHVSALNADPQKGASDYLKTKGAGEYQVLMAAKLQTTVFRPSVIFGEGDAFFNRFAGLLRLSPCCFPLACAQARFAPVWVDDVVAAMIYALENPAATAGNAYDLCGPAVYTLGELVAYAAAQTGLSRRIIPLGRVLSRAQAALLGLLPGKPFSTDNYRSLQTDSVCEKNGFAELGITPQSVETIVPAYLGRQASRARYDTFRWLARHG